MGDDLLPYSHLYNYLTRMPISYRKSRLKHARLILITVLGVVLFVLMFRVNAIVCLFTRCAFQHNDHRAGEIYRNQDLDFKNLRLPRQNKLSISLQKHNQLAPRNLDLYPNLAKDHILIVLYVHNRPHYLRIVVDSLSRVAGINETLLIVSHDGYFEEMSRIVKSIRFCLVKQIFAPYSPHIFPSSFPGVSRFDCKGRDDPNVMKCEGSWDQYGNHRSPKIVSLKHHWWWMMNTVWDGLEETRQHYGDILFIEEDHFIYPNAYRNLQILTELRPNKCPDCYAANLAPSVVFSRGEEWKVLIAERMGNVGYAFNHSVWRKIHRKAREYCLFDDYNWDITMWAAVYPSFGVPVYTLRGPRRSALHFGECGLHQQAEACMNDGGVVEFEVEDVDRVPSVGWDWRVYVWRQQDGYRAGFKGWGGWGDLRDRQLCLDFANMYRAPQAV